MLALFSAFLMKHARLSTIAFFVMVFLSFHVFIFPYFLAKIGSVTGSVIPDLMFGFDESQVYRFLAEAGHDGRQAYLGVLLFVDSIYPIVYSFLMALFIGLAVKRIARRPQYLPYISLFPFGAAIADYLENAGMIVLFIAYPAQIEIVVLIASIFNMLKWVLAGLSITIILLCLLIVLLYSIRAIKQRA